MALNPQFPNYANGAAGTEVIFWTVVGGLPLYRLPAKMVATGFGAAMVGGGSTPYPPDSDEFSPPKIISPGALEGIFIEGETITHTPALVEGAVTSQVVEWFRKTTTGTTQIATGTDTYVLQPADVDGFIFVKVTAIGPYGQDSDVTETYGPVIPNDDPTPVLTATFTPSEEVGTDAELEITACTDGTVTKVQVYADQSGLIQTVNVSALPVTVTQSGASLINYIGQNLIFKVTVLNNGGKDVTITYSCGPIVGVAPEIAGTGDISGTPNVGQTLTFTPPIVTGTPTPTVTYNWYRSGSSVVIATGLTYVTTNDDLGKLLFVGTIASNPLGFDSTSSDEFGPILGTAPVITDPGQLDPESVNVGQTITLDPIPTATGNPTPSISWVWRDAADEAKVLQLGGTTYIAKSEDIGTSIVVASTATNSSGSDEGLTNETSVNTQPPTIVTPSQLLDLTPAVRQQIGGVKAKFTGYPTPVVTSFGFWDYTDPLNPEPLVDGEDVVTYDVKDEDFGKEIAFVTVAENAYGVTTSVSTVSSPVSGFLDITGESQISFATPVLPGSVLNGGAATFDGVPTPAVSQFGFAYENGDGTYTPILSSVGDTSYTVEDSDASKSIVFYTTATNSAVPAGVTSYSNSTGPIGDIFEFQTTGAVVSAGPAPIVGETLTITYAVTQPRNQKNAPPGPVVLSWNWISDADPTTPLTTANAETYEVQPEDYGHRIGLVWLAVNGAESLGAQSDYSEPVGGNAPAVLTNGSLAGDVSAIPATLTLTPATFSGTDLTVSWVWVDDEDKEWQEGGLTLQTSLQMQGRQMRVKTTATNFAGSAVAETPFSDVIGADDVPVFTYNGTITGATSLPTIFSLDPAKASAPSGRPPVLEWQWYRYDPDIDQSFSIPGTVNESSLDTTTATSNYWEGYSVFVRTTATTPSGSATTDTNMIGPLGVAPTPVQPGQINGQAIEDTILTLSPLPTFKGEQPMEVNYVWLIANQDESDEVILATNQPVVTVPYFSGRYRYVFVRSTASNVYGTVTQSTRAFGPIQPNPNPVITKSGRIEGEAVTDGSNLTYLLPTVSYGGRILSTSWKWKIVDLTDPTFKPVTIQENGTVLSINSSWVKDPVYNQLILGRTIAVTVEIGADNDAVLSETVYLGSPISFVPWMMSSIVPGGEKANYITGGHVGPDAYYAQQGTVLSYSNFVGGFYDNLLFTNSGQTVPAQTTWSWYFDADGGNDGHIYSTSVTNGGCYAALPRVYADGLAVAPARLKAVAAPTFGVYGIKCGYPSSFCNVGPGMTFTVAPPSGGGVAPTIEPIGFVTTGNGWTYVSNFKVLTPGSGYNTSLDSNLNIFVDGVPYTAQVFTWQKGYVVQDVEIVYAGYGYVDDTLNLVFETNEDNDFPASGIALAPTDTIIIQQGGETCVIPDLPGPGQIGVVAKVAGLTNETPPLYVSAANKLRFAKQTGGTSADKPIIALGGDIIGNVATGDVQYRRLVYRPSLCANWKNANVGVGGDPAAHLLPPEIGALAIAPTQRSIIWFAVNLSSSVLSILDRDVLEIDIRGQYPALNSGPCRIYVRELITNAYGITTYNSSDTYWPGYNETSVSPFPFIPISGYLKLSYQANSAQYTLSDVYGRYLPSGGQFPADLSGSYTNTGVVASNLQLRLTFVNYDGTTTVATGSGIRDLPLSSNVCAIRGELYDTTQPTVKVGLTVVETPPLGWYVSRGLDPALLSNVTNKQNAYVSGTGRITSYTLGGALNPTPGTFCATGLLNAQRSFYRTPPTLNLPCAGCPNGQLPFGAYRGYLSSGKGPDNQPDQIKGWASCAYPDTFGYYDEVSNFEEYTWALQNPPPRIQTGAIWAWGFNTPQTLPEFGLPNSGAVYIGPEYNGTSPQAQWSVPANISFNPAWTWSSGFQMADSANGPWVPVSNFILPGKYVRWSLYNVNPSTLLNPVTGTPLNTGGEWWLTDVGGDNPEMIVDSSSGWTTPVLITNQMVGKNLLFRQVATPAGTCVDTAESITPFYTAGYISTDRYFPLPFPPLA